MGLFDRLFSRKDSAVGPLISLRQLGRPVWSGRDFTAYSKEGYEQNAIAYRCVRMTADACAGIELQVYQGEEQLSESPLLDLLRRPNPFMSGRDLIAEAVSYFKLHGNLYLEGVTLDGQLEEIYSLRPDRMKVIPGRRGYPEAYRYEVGEGRCYDFNQIVDREQIAPIMHMREFHPTDDWYGLSPISPAAYSIDTFNQAGAFNKALLDNSASPSGALVYGGGEDGNATLSAEQFERLKKELEENYSGAKNAGKPLLLDGGLDWRAMGMSPREIEFISSKREAAREICQALSVPSMLLGIPGDNTYSNYSEANRSFYRGSVLPLMDRLCEGLTNWVSPLFSGLRVGYDRDEIEALYEERARKWEQVSKATFLSTDEKREAVGYEPYQPGQGAGSSILGPAGQLPIEEAGFTMGGGEPDE